MPGAVRDSAPTRCDRMLIRAHAPGSLGSRGRPARQPRRPRPRDLHRRGRGGPSLRPARLSVVGLPDAAVQEARERVRSGLANQAFQVPARRIVANLAPADLRKAGPQYDLPLALAILCASGQVAPASPVGAGASASSRSTGRRPPVPGALAMAEHAARHGWRRSSCRGGQCCRGHARARGRDPGPGDPPSGCGPPRGADGAVPGAARRPGPPGERRGGPRPDLAEVRGQGAARRALEVAAAGGHSMLMLGPPGGGKMLARRLPASCRRSHWTRRSRSPASTPWPGCSTRAAPWSPGARSARRTTPSRRGPRGRRAPAAARGGEPRPRRGAVPRRGVRLRAVGAERPAPAPRGGPD